MTQTAIAGFIEWLNGKLRELNTDEGVFGSYIVGILEEESESLEEKTDAIEGILSEILETNLQEIITEILNKWEEYHPKENVSAKNATSIDVNEQLARLLEAQKITIKERHYTDEEKKIKQQILAQYSQTEIEEEDEYEDSDGEVTKQNGHKPASSSGIERNTNASDVMQMQKERREQARLESAAKKQKDKDDREKQKQLREEKKEKRKTVKGERRR